MRNFLLASFVAALTVSNAQQSKLWSIGAQFGLSGNFSKFSGGMSDANARFIQAPYRGSSLALAVRFDLNERWKFESGLGYGNIGFEYGILNNYSLSKDRNIKEASKSFVETIEMPLLASYKFKPNCRNSKSFIGLGITNIIVGEKVKYKESDNSEDVQLNVSPVSNEMLVKSGYYVNPVLIFGKERTLNKGGVLSFAVQINFGTRNIASSKVNYTLDGINYNHEFSNNGSSIGLRLTYFLRPLNRVK